MKPKKPQKTTNKKLAIPPVAIVDNIVFSRKEAWAYYKLAACPFDFLSPQAKVSLTNGIMTALAALCSNEGKKVDCHILVTSAPLDVDSWEEQTLTNYQSWQKQVTLPFEKFLAAQVADLERGDFKKRVTYLGVKLFNRGSFSMDGFNIFEFSWKDIYANLGKAVSAIFAVPGEAVESGEEKRARNAEKEIYRVLSSGTLRAIRPTAEELLLTIKKQFYPFMPAPYLETDYGTRVGLNDIMLETGGYIKNTIRSLEFNQQIGTDNYIGHRATLSFSRFPNDRLSMPNGNPPFLYLPTQQGLPYTIFARFSLLPSGNIKKELEKKKMETDDELKNLGNSGQAAGASVGTTLRDLQDLDAELEANKDPWISGSYRMTIEMPNADSLATAISEIKQEYAQQDTILTWTTGDQMDMFLEEMPGGTLRVPSFNQMTNLAMVGISGFCFGSAAGDPVNEKVVTRRK